MRHVRILAGRLDNLAGSHKYNRELASRLAQRGYRVSVVCFSGDSRLSKDIEIYEVAPAKHSERHVAWRFAPVLRYRECGRGVSRANLDRPDIVIAAEHLFIKGHHYRFSNVPFIYLPHSWTVRDEINSYNIRGILGYSIRRLYLHLQRWSLLKADRTVRFTRAAASALANEYGTSVTSRITVNPMGIDFPDSEMTSRRHCRDVCRLLFVGRLIDSKNVELVIRALSEFSRGTWELDIVGDGPDRTRLEEMALSLQLTDRVRFHGFQNHVNRFYADADLFVFPSLLENCPIVLMEAMACGVPCLAFRPDGLRFRSANDELLEDSVTGFLADNDAQFIQRMRWAIEHRDQLRSIGTSAQMFINEHHSWDRHLERYESLFEELCSSKRTANVKSPALEQFQ